MIFRANKIIAFSFLLVAVGLLFGCAGRGIPERKEAAIRGFGSIDVSFVDYAMSGDFALVLEPGSFSFEVFSFGNLVLKYSSDRQGSSIHVLGRDIDPSHAGKGLFPLSVSQLRMIADRFLGGTLADRTDFGTVAARPDSDGTHPVLVIEVPDKGTIRLVLLERS